MDVQKVLNKVDGVSDGVQHFVNRTGTVLPVPFSHPNNEVGIHWLRISFSTKLLGKIAQFLSQIWGDHTQDGRGLWSYDSRLAWSSGVSLNYDEDEERSDRVHSGRMTLDIPGGACDELTVSDLQLLTEFCEKMDGEGKRVDVFFDDYNRITTPSEVYEAAHRGDYSGFRTVNRITRENLQGYTHDEVSFGRRGSYGNGKYLRFYDKELESNGEIKCCRWEVEFTGDKADQVFHKLAATKPGADAAAFATLCGALIAGCITFVHRTAEKNIGRLGSYAWWEEILVTLGNKIVIRTSRKKDSLTGKIEWVKKNVSPSLACLKKVFVTNEAFFRWVFDVCKDGEGRMNPFTEQIARDNEGSVDYRWGELSKIEDKIYDRAMSQL